MCGRKLESVLPHEIIPKVCVWFYGMKYTLHGELFLFSDYSRGVWSVWWLNGCQWTADVSSALLCSFLKAECSSSLCVMSFKFLWMWLIKVFFHCKENFFSWWIPQIESRSRAANWIQICCHMWIQTNTPIALSNLFQLPDSLSVAHTHSGQRPCRIFST